MHGVLRNRALPYDFDFRRVREKAPRVIKVEEVVGWAKLWYTTLELGQKAVTGLQILSRAMSHHGQGKHPCHLCMDNDLPIEKPVLDHVLEAHCI